METTMIISIGITIICIINYLMLCSMLNRNPLNPFEDRDPKLIGWTISQKETEASKN